MSAMIHAGLVSITFRKLSPTAIIELACRTRLAAIEWGGDMHVPHGDLKQAKTVGRLTRHAGITVAAYGSYYHVGHSEEEGLTFTSVLATALSLGAPLIRVWAGKLASAEAEAAYRKKIAGELCRLAGLAADAGLTIACEFHDGTLTDTSASAVQLLNDIPHPAARMYWQPPVGLSEESCVAGLRAILPRLANLHVFHWDAATRQRLPLKDGAGSWRRYLDLVNAAGRDCYALLEFVRDDSPDALREDARTLQSWLSA